MNILAGKVAIITGATRGIGREIAKRFAEEACSVAFCGRKRSEAMIEVEQEIESMGVKVKAYECNVASLDDAKRFVGEVLNDFGHIDILVNNAGVTDDNAIKRMTEDQWDNVINTNLKSVFCMTKAVQPAMWKQASGSVINISSVVGIAGNANQCNYAASKAGIIGFTKTMTKEMGTRNIRHNVVAPGFIEVGMTAEMPAEMKENWCKSIPLHRAGTPKEVADACLFLASDMSTYVTGNVLRVCGGMEDA